MMIFFVRNSHAWRITSYFPNLPVPFNPFTAEDVPEEAKNDFNEVIRDAGRTDFSPMPVTRFWISDYSHTCSVWDSVAQFPFPTMHLCGTGFSSLLVITSTCRNRFVAGNDLGCALLQRLLGNFWFGEKEATSTFTPMLDVYAHCRKCCLCGLLLSY